MSNDATVEEAQRELDEMEKQLTQAAEEEKEKAEQKEKIETLEALPPDPVPSTAPEPSTPPEVPVTPQPSQGEKPKDDPMEWAKAKGFKSPEDMARALLQKEREFHESRQKQNPTPPPLPEWQPRPEMGYGYPPPPPPAYGYQPPLDPRQLANEYGMLPEDFDKVARLAADINHAALKRERANWQREVGEIRRVTDRNNELMTLMQDPAFRDVRVQKEIHAVLDSDPSIYQRERLPMTRAYEMALGNMARKTLQQGVHPETPHTNGSTPPVTAGGGNGSAFTVPRKITQREFDRLDVKEQEKLLLQLERANRR